MSKRRSIVRGFDNLRTMGEYLQATARQNRKDAEDVAARKALQALQAEDQGFQREQMEWGREDQKRQNAESVAKSAEARAEQFNRARVRKNLEGGNPQRAGGIAFSRGIPLPDHVVDLYSPPKDKLAELEDELKLRARYKDPEKPDVEKPSPTSRLHALDAPQRAAADAAIARTMEGLGGRAMASSDSIPGVEIGEKTKPATTKQTKFEMAESEIYSALDATKALGLIDADVELTEEGTRVAADLMSADMKIRTRAAKKLRSAREVAKLVRIAED